jgi:hypothetical protein
MDNFTDQHTPQVLMMIMIATFIQITSKEKKTFHQMIIPAIYNFKTVIMTTTKFA